MSKKLARAVKKAVDEGFAEAQKPKLPTYDELVARDAANVAAAKAAQEATAAAQAEIKALAAKMAETVAAFQAQATAAPAAPAPATTATAPMAAAPAAPVEVTPAAAAPMAAAPIAAAPAAPAPDLTMVRASAPQAPATSLSPANMHLGVRDYFSLSSAELAALQPGQARQMFETQLAAINRSQGAPPRPQVPQINGASHGR